MLPARIGSGQCEQQKVLCDAVSRCDVARCAAQVTEVVTKEYGVVNRPKGRAKLRAERRAAATAGAGGEDVQEPHAAAAAAADEEK